MNPHNPPLSRALQQLSAAPAGTAIHLLGTLAAVANVRQLQHLAEPQPVPTPTPTPTDHPLPTRASHAATRLNAWLGQICINLLDHDKVSPKLLDDHLAALRTVKEQPDVTFAAALKGVRLQIEGRSLDGQTVLTHCLGSVFDDPAHGPALNGFTPEAQEALAQLRLERAALIGLLMYEVALQAGDDGTASPPTYDADKHKWTPPKKGTRDRS